MQDGARPHLPARYWITSKFGDHTIGEGLAQPWPARSPDLTPLDFFFWGWLKDAIYRDGPIGSIPELKARIVQCCNAVPQEFLGRACRSVKKRCSKILEVNGGHIENYLWFISAEFWFICVIFITVNLILILNKVTFQKNPDLSYSSGEIISKLIEKCMGLVHQAP